MVELAQHPRIVVIGSSGAGKTTFARQLSSLLGHRHVELDVLHWGPNWTPRDGFVDSVRAAAAGDAWVIDGNYGDVRDLLWPRATALVWLNYGFPLVMARALVRTLRRGITGEVVFGNRERLLYSFFHPDGVPWWVIRSFSRHRREVPELLRRPEFAHLELFEARVPRHADASLRRVARAREAPHYDPSLP